MRTIKLNYRFTKKIDEKIIFIDRNFSPVMPNSRKMLSGKIIYVYEKELFAPSKMKIEDLIQNQYNVNYQIIDTATNIELSQKTLLELDPTEEVFVTATFPIYKVGNWKLLINHFETVEIDEV
jgi:hypothetical protein